MVHAMAHVLGGLKDFPHGECNGLLLKGVCEYNYSSCPERYDTIAETLAGSYGGEAKQGVEGILSEIDRGGRGYRD